MLLPSDWKGVNLLNTPGGQERLGLVADYLRRSIKNAQRGRPSELKRVWTSYPNG